MDTRRHSRLPRPIRRLQHRIGYRGFFLITLGIVDTFQGWNFIEPGNPGQAVSNAYLARAIAFDDLEWSNWTWAVIWWIVAAFCFYNAFKKQRDHWGFLAAIFVKVFYVVALIYATSNGMSDGPRRIAVWTWFAITVWIMSRLPEPPWTLVDLNDEMEDIERSGELPTHTERGEDA